MAYRNLTSSFDQFRHSEVENAQVVIPLHVTQRKESNEKLLANETELKPRQDQSKTNVALNVSPMPAWMELLDEIDGDIVNINTQS